VPSTPRKDRLIKSRTSSRSPGKEPYPTTRDARQGIFRDVSGTLADVTINAGTSGFINRMASASLTFKPTTLFAK
jgi:hypothetical protein